MVRSSAPEFQVTQPFPVGIKEWVKCDTADVDICFVHGLTGNRDSTWTAKGQTEPWPKTLLASELSSSRARIFTYGYDAYTIRTGATAKTRMTDHAIDFLQKVTANRAQNSALDRPLIIIAHSLGGLVSKQAILKSKNSAEPHLRNLYNMTEGIMFLGTPHTGAWMAKWAKITVDVFGILKSTNPSLLDALQTRNELLHSLNQDFLTLLRTLREGPEHGKKINVICFFEAYGYPGIGQIVPKESATFAFDLPISINANHSEMVKFATTNDDGYQSVVAELARWTKSLRYEKQSGSVSKLFTRCRLSLTFKDMMVREEFVAKPQNETCQWIYHDRQYKEWITDRKPLLWIKAGNPGSGKSILMKSLYKQRKQDLKGSQTILLRFFFNARGSDMEKSREALYKTLLHSLIQESPLMLCEVLALYLEKETRGNIVQWQTPELVDVFHDKIKHFRTSDIEILIDALDECSEAEVLRVIRRFEESIQVPRSHTTLRVCWSSRFYPHISLRTVQGIELVVNNNNGGDIKQYVQSILPIDSHKPLRSVSEDIIARAQGNFLWASLVSDKLIKAFHTGKGVNELKDTLRSTPDGLDNYFLEIFKAPSFTEEQRHDLQRIALFVLGASRSLSVEELHTALKLENPSPNMLLSDITFQSEDIERFKKHLTHVSGGLIEVANIKKLLHQTMPPDRPSYQSPSHSSGQIAELQVIHESVREFFLGKGLPILQASS
ncbi:Alpha/Beta hydrolase protein, partial [Xylaria flabelliformis]